VKDNLAMDALVEFINEVKSEKTAGRTDEQLAPVRDFQRKAQSHLDAGCDRRVGAGT